jgi:hypothetical protein
MPRRLLVIATLAAGLTVLAIELVMRRLATEPRALPARRTAPAGAPTLRCQSCGPCLRTGWWTRTAGPHPEELRGSVWVADFIFTSCKSVCPVLSAKMVQVQRAIPDPRLKFVSFSVDPERDTPRRCAPTASGGPRTRPAGRCSPTRPRALPSSRRG